MRWVYRILDWAPRQLRLNLWVLSSNRHRKAAISLIRICALRRTEHGKTGDFLVFLLAGRNCFQEWNLLQVERERILIRPQSTLVHYVWECYSIKERGNLSDGHSQSRKNSLITNINRHKGGLQFKLQYAPFSPLQYEPREDERLNESRDNFFRFINSWINLNSLASFIHRKADGTLQVIVQAG